MTPLGEGPQKIHPNTKDPSQKKEEPAPSRKRMISRRLFASSSLGHSGYRWYTSVTDKADRIQRVLAAKHAANLSYDDLADRLGVTNTYAAQLLLGQAKLTPTTAAKLQEALPSISAHDLSDMQNHFPMRSFDDNILKEPNAYRLYEAVTHYAEAIKALINEQCGDGIMSAIDFYCTVGTTTGKNGEQRVVVTLNGKYSCRAFCDFC